MFKLWLRFRYASSSPRPEVGLGLTDIKEQTHPLEMMSPDQIEQNKGDADLGLEALSVSEACAATAGAQTPFSFSRLQGANADL